MCNFLTVKGSSATDLFFYEELNRLGVTTNGLIGHWQPRKSSLNSPKEEKPVQIKKLPRSSSCTDLDTKEDDVDNDDTAYEDLRSLFLAKLQTRKSFVGRIPLSNIGLLYTDAASTILTKSFLESSLKCH